MVLDIVLFAASLIFTGLAAYNRGRKVGHRAGYQDGKRMGRIPGDGSLYRPKATGNVSKR